MPETDGAPEEVDRLKNGVVSHGRKSRVYAADGTATATIGGKVSHVRSRRAG